MAIVDMLQIARILREVAAEEILPRWRNLAEGDITTKAGQGLVTVADHAAERALAERLGAALPGSIVVGEEAVAAAPDLLERFRTGLPVWVVDPIDGTRKFTEGSPVFDVMVGLVVSGQPVAGWILSPVENTLYLGEAGSGGWIYSADGSERRITAPAGAALREMVGIIGTGGFRSRGLPDPSMAADRFAGYVGLQCAGHNYGRLFAGEGHFLINFSTHPWDHLPGLAIASAAGFHAARHDGLPFDPLDKSGGVLVATDQQSWHAIHGLLLGQTASTS